MDYKQKLLDSFSDSTNHINEEPFKTRLEVSVEQLRDWNLFNTLEEILEWYQDQARKSDMEVRKKPLADLNGWEADPESGDLHHNSGGFFSVIGLRVDSTEREVKSGHWEQPILKEANDDAGILGLLRKRFRGIPHYLVQAKEEPGNYNLTQLSPTLQATFSNLDQDHQGRRPYFADLFEDHQQNADTSVLRANWVTEDGGRLYRKRNYAMLMEVDERHEISLPDNFRWISLYQIKHLLRTRSCVNPHIRSILSLI